jgi:hypothetical protein
MLEAISLAERLPACFEKLAAKLITAMACMINRCRSSVAMTRLWLTVILEITLALEVIKVLANGG